MGLHKHPMHCELQCYADLLYTSWCMHTPMQARYLFSVTVAIPLSMLDTTCARVILTKVTLACKVLQGKALIVLHASHYCACQLGNACNSTCRTEGSA